MHRGSSQSSEENDELTICILRWSDSTDEDKEEEPPPAAQPVQPPLEHDLTQETKLHTAAHPKSCEVGRVRPGERVNVFSMLAARESNASGRGRFSQAELCHVGSRFLPTDVPEVVEQIGSRAYIGQFSGDGSLFVAGFQDRRIRIYDVDNGWSLKKHIIARNLRWTVTDTALSPDQRFLVYASITPIVHLVNVGSEAGGITSLANVTDIHDGLNFAADCESDSVFGLWSVQFSGDGRELVAGSSDKSIYVYDLETSRAALRIPAHRDDVNTVVFADGSSNVLYSGSDDKDCKVWDRRCFGSVSRPSGKLVGHLEGITFIDSRGDGRYFISNGKDQTTKLWDIRKLSSSVSQTTKKVKTPSFNWDYRWMDYPGYGKDVKHPQDQSIMTYKGHQILRTLIRCYFSPAFTTGQKYIYTGSHDGCVYIYDVVTGELVSRLKHHQSTVRDCSWHPTQPTLVSSSWDGKIVRWQHHHGERTLEGTSCHSLQSKWRNTVTEEFYDSD